MGNIGMDLLIGVGSGLILAAIGVGVKKHFKSNKVSQKDSKNQITLQESNQNTIMIREKDNDEKDDKKNSWKF